MFSEEALVSMANGTFKSIKSIVRGDLILNKFGNPILLFIFAEQIYKYIKYELKN